MIYNFQLKYFPVASSNNRYYDLHPSEQQNLFSGGDLAAIQEPEGLTGSASMIVGGRGAARIIAVKVIIFTVGQLCR